MRTFRFFCCMRCCNYKLASVNTLKKETETKIDTLALVKKKRLYVNISDNIVTMNYISHSRVF